jgi:HD superfamily phosphohydrolase YqeK
MAKILYVKDELHHQLKVMSTQLNKSMQEATEEAVAQWLTAKQAEQSKLLQAFNSIKEKLGPEDRKIMETILGQQNTINVFKKDLNIEESKVLEALLAKKDSGQ